MLREGIIATESYVMVEESDLKQERDAGHMTPLKESKER